MAGGSAVDRRPNRFRGSPGRRRRRLARAARIRSSSSKPLRPARAARTDGVSPIKPATGRGAIGGFCFQQTGIDRASGHRRTQRSRATLDERRPDPQRVEPDIAFTGTNDTRAVGRLVRAEQHAGQSACTTTRWCSRPRAISRRHRRRRFHWTAVGVSGTGFQRVLTTRRRPAASTSAPAPRRRPRRALLPEQESGRRRRGSACRGRHDERSRHARRFRGSRGTRTPRQSNRSSCSRLVVAGARLHFELANDGAADLDRRTSDPPGHHVLGNTPYVSWREDIGGGVEGLLGSLHAPVTRSS